MVKLHEYGAAKLVPAVSWAAVLMVAVYVVPYARLTVGWKVAVTPA